MLFEDEILTLEKKAQVDSNERSESDNKEGSNQNEVSQLLAAIGSVIAIIGIWTFLSSIHI